MVIIWWHQTRFSGDQDFSVPLLLFLWWRRSSRPGNRTLSNRPKDEFIKKIITLFYDENNPNTPFLLIFHFNPINSLQSWTDFWKGVFYIQVCLISWLQVYSHSLFMRFCWRKALLWRRNKNVCFCSLTAVSLLAEWRQQRPEWMLAPVKLSEKLISCTLYLIPSLHRGVGHVFVLHHLQP